MNSLESILVVCFSKTLIKMQFKSIYIKSSQTAKTVFRPTYLKPFKQCQLLQLSDPSLPSCPEERLASSLTPPSKLSKKSPRGQGALNLTDRQDLLSSRSNEGLHLLFVSIVTADNNSSDLADCKQNSLLLSQYEFNKKFSNYLNVVNILSPRSNMLPKKDWLCNNSLKTDQFSKLQSAMLHSPIKFTEVNLSNSPVDQEMTLIQQIKKKGSQYKSTLASRDFTYLTTEHMDRRHVGSMFTGLLNAHMTSGHNLNFLGCVIIAVGHIPLFISSDEIQQAVLVPHIDALLVNNCKVNLNKLIKINRALINKYKE